MLANLIENAIRHNTQGGWVTATTGIVNGRPQIVVENSGHKVDTNAVGRLFQPFERIDGDRATYPDGHGLGLSIVRAIAAAHDAGIKVLLRPEGGLTTTIIFPEHGAAAERDGPGGAAGHDRESKSPIVRVG
jgi:signal transduction histidine kinase